MAFPAALTSGFEEPDGLVVDVKFGLAAPEVFVVSDGFAAVDVLALPGGVVEVLALPGAVTEPAPFRAASVVAVEPVVAVDLGVEVDVIEVGPPRVILGLLPTLLTTLFSGARMVAPVLGGCTPDVRLVKIAMFYPPFFTSDDRVAMSVTGLSFAPLGNVFGGATGAAR